MSIEDRLRRAIEARTGSVEPSPDALDRITDKLLDKEETMDVRAPRSRWLLGAAAAVALLAVIAAGLAVRDDGGGNTETEGVDIADRPSTTTERDSTTSTSTSTTSTTSAPPGVAPQTPTSGTEPLPPAESEDELSRRIALWPRPSSTVRFDTPEAVARSFARNYARFADPVINPYQTDGPSSGVVPVQPFADGPETRVLVRQLGDGKWYVAAARSDNLRRTEPGGNYFLQCPVHVAGTALAYEGHVDVRIDAYQPDGARVELGRGYVTASGSPPAGPYAGDIPCRLPSGEVEGHGILTLWTESQDSESPGTLEIDAVPVALSADALPD